MMDHNENNLGAAIKSLRDTVTPAVDPDDPQANEQLRLTIDYLEFLKSRIYDVHPRTRYELGHQITVAGSLIEDAHQISEHAASQLDESLSNATLLYDDPAAHTRDLQAASSRLWAAVRGTVREARTASAEVRARVSSTVLAGVDPLIEVESAWYRPFGFEPDPSSLPEIATLLGGDRSTPS